MTGVDNTNFGAEFGTEVNVTPDLTVNAVGAWGHYVYSSRPKATITRDNDNSYLAKDMTVYFKNYRLGGIPQAAASVGFRYNGRQYWFIGASYSYFGEIWIDPTPDRRTEKALQGLVSDDFEWEKILEQEKMNDGYTLDIYGGKSWRIDVNYLRVNLSVSNALNNKDITVIAFEQLRTDYRDIDKFPSKLAYMYGTNFFLNINYSF